MSRTHYVDIARVLAGDYASAAGDAERRTVRAITFSLADVFAKDNTRFNRALLPVLGGGIAVLRMARLARAGHLLRHVTLLRLWRFFRVS
jgi:hypothetical protein